MRKAIASVACLCCASALAVTASREWTQANFYTKVQIDDNVGPRIQTVENAVENLGDDMSMLVQSVSDLAGRVGKVDSGLESKRGLSDLNVYETSASWASEGRDGQSVRSLLGSNGVKPVWDETRGRWLIPDRVGSYVVDWERLSGDESVTDRSAERIVFHSGGETSVGYEDETGYHSSFVLSSLVASVGHVPTGTRLATNAYTKAESDELFLSSSYRMSSAFSNDVASVVTGSTHVAASHFDYIEAGPVTVDGREYQFHLVEYNPESDEYILGLYDFETFAEVGNGIVYGKDVVLGAEVTGSDYEHGVYGITATITMIIGERHPACDVRSLPSVVFTNDLDAAVGGLSNAVLNAAAVAIGRSAVSTGSSSSGIGSSTAVGRSAIASSDFSTAFGYDAQATADYASAFGQSAHALGPHSTALGRSSLVTAAGTDSVSVGWGSYCNRTNAVAIGHQAKVTGANAVQIGSGTNTQSASLKFRDTVVVNGKGKIPSASLEHSVSGVSFDFKGGENAVKVVYEQMTNVIIRLGGKVVNPIPFN